MTVLRFLLASGQISWWMLISLNLILLDSSKAADLEPKVAISPPRIELSDKDSLTTSVTVLNLSSVPMPVTVSVHNWELDDNNQIKIIPPTSQSLDQWLVINPVHFTIPANSQQTVRLAVRPRTTPEPGEHRAIIYFQESSGSEGNVRINFRVGVPVYANFGDIIYDQEVHDVSFSHNDNALIFDITNRGNVHVRPEGRYLIVTPDNFRSEVEILKRLVVKDQEVTVNALGSDIDSGVLGFEPVLANDRRVVKDKMDLPETLQPPFYLALKAFVGGELIERVLFIEAD